MHEFSCSIHPAWTVPKNPRSLRPNSNRKFCHEPEVKYELEDLGLNMKELIKKQKEALIEVSSLVDPSAITHATTCNCIGCVMKRGNVPARQPIHVETTSVAQLKAQMNDLHAQLTTAMAKEEKAIRDAEDEEIIRDEEEAVAQEDDGTDSLPGELTTEELEAAVEKARQDAQMD